MRKIDWAQVLFDFIIIAIVILVLGCIATSVYCFITYGNRPITEIPGWALPFMFKR